VHDVCVTVDARDLSRSEQECRGDAPRDSGSSPTTHSPDLLDSETNISTGDGESFPAPDRIKIGGALEALNGDVLRKRSLEVSSTSFTTIISIILGVALALVAQNTFPSPSPLAGLQSACMLMLFVCTFYYFLSVSIMLRWAPSFVDCAMPFIIASLEIPPAYFLGHIVGWSAWLAILFLVIAAGVGSTIIWSPISHFGGDPHAHGMLHRLFRELSVVLVAGALSLGTLSLLAQLIPAGGRWWGFGSCGAVLATLGMIVARMEIWLSRIHAYYGVNRPPFN
jgi:hypothetical protein